jgi:hypothetical protein
VGEQDGRLDVHLLRGRHSYHAQARCIG